MSWDWTAGHIRACSQDDVSLSVSNTLDKLTHGELRGVSSTKTLPDELNPVAMSGLVFVISSCHREWITVWNYSRRLLEWLFRLSKLSGVLFHGHDELTDNTVSQGWDYTVWENGRRVGWFVSNPAYEFRYWGLDALQTVVVPYLLGKGILIEEMTSRVGILGAIKDASDLFSGDLPSLINTVGSLAPLKEIEDWHTRSPIEATYDIPRLFDLPFAGPNYNVIDLTSYIDILRGAATPPQDLHYYDLSVRGEERYTRETSWKDSASQFLPIRIEGPGIALFSQELAHVLYYE